MQPSIQRSQLSSAISKDAKTSTERVLRVELTITTFDELDGDAVLNTCVFFGTRP